MAEPSVIVVGCCTDTSARIFCCAPGNGNQSSVARIAWRGADDTSIQTQDKELRPADSYQFEVFELEDLPQSATLEYAIDVAPTLRKLTENNKLLKQSPKSFRLLPSNRPLRLGLVSCNGANEESNERRRYELWKKLKKQIDRGAIDMVLHCGDQIYADPIWRRYDADHRNQGLTPADKKRVHELTREYRQWYAERSWNAPDVAAVLCAIPNLMTWDDHDIFDGYGSNDDDDKPPQQAFFLAAKQAYEEFQLSHGPEPLHDASYLRGFVHGGVGVLLLDTRSNRMWRKGTVLGEAQFEAIDRWCAENVSSLKRLYVVSSIPLIHVDVALAETLRKIMPGTEGMEDDLRDCWTASRNRDECQRLAKRLFSILRDNPELQITVLSGDVHVGAIGEIRSTLKGHRRADGEIPRIFQVTSSGIGHPPPSGIKLSLIKRTAANIALSLGTNDIKARPCSLMGVDGLFLARRNFAILNLCDHSGNDWEPHGNLLVEFHAEGERDPKVLRQVLNGPGRGKT